MTHPFLRYSSWIRRDTQRIIPENVSDDQVERDQQPEQFVRDGRSIRGIDDKELRGEGDETDQSDRASNPAFA